MRSPLRRLISRVPRRTWSLAALLLLAIAAALPLLDAGGLLNTRGGGDSPFLLQRVQQLVTALADGHFPVRWMPDAAYGYGYPFYNYYAPLSIYVAATFRLFGFSYVLAVQLAQVTGFLLAAWAIFGLARRWFHSEWAALLAAIAYTVAPFHMVNVYVRGDSLAEFWAMALYPTTLLAADRFLAANSVAGAESPAGKWAQRRAMAFLGLSFAALILSHNISALIFTPFLLLYLILVGWREGNWRRDTLRRALGGLLLGLLLSAWFWLPALAETSLVQTEPVTRGYFHYGNHFLSTDLAQTSFLFDYEVAGGRAFRMGLVQALLLVAGLAALLWHWRRTHARPKASGGRRLFLLLAVAVSTFMMTPLSRPLWDNLPLLPFVQFPWRFLSVQALAGALATAALAYLPGKRLLVILVGALLLVAMLTGLHTDHLTLSDADVTAERLAQYEWFTGNIGSTVSAEYLPRGVDPRPFTSAWLNDAWRDRVQVLEGSASVSLLSRRTARQRWRVDAGNEGAVLEFPTLFWPGWQAVVDGRETAAGSAAGSGLISLRVPEGTHTVTLVLGRTPVRLGAEAASLLALLVVAFWLLASAGWRRAGGGWRKALSHLLTPSPLLLLGALAALGIVGRIWQQSPHSPATLTWDFAQMGYLHHAPQGISFEDGVLLEAYRYSAQTVRPGETLQVMLEWSAEPSQVVPDEMATLDLATPAVHRFSHAPALVGAEQPLRPGLVIYELTIPESAPPGMYVPRLRRQDVSALTPSGETRGDLFLRPLRLADPIPAGGTGSGLRVRTDAVEVPETLPPVSASAEGLFDCASPSPSGGELLLQLAWFTPQPLSRNYTVSLRLAEAGGALVAQCDVQPGYGYLPSGGWPAGRWVPDRLSLPLPQRLPRSDFYTLVATLYARPGQPVLTRQLGQLAWKGETLAFSVREPVYTLPDGIERVNARFGDVAALRGYEASRTSDALVFTLYWESLGAGERDYVRFAHLLDAETGSIIVQSDGAPQNNTYPTGQWIDREIVADRIVFRRDDLSDGPYQLALGFYPPQDPLSRLAVYDEQGAALPDNQFLLTPAGP